MLGSRYPVPVSLGGCCSPRASNLRDSWSSAGVSAPTIPGSCRCSARPLFCSPLLAAAPSHFLRCVLQGVGAFEPGTEPMHMRWRLFDPYATTSLRRKPMATLAPRREHFRGSRPWAAALMVLLVLVGLLCCALVPCHAHAHPRQAHASQAHAHAAWPSSLASRLMQLFGSRVGRSDSHLQASSSSSSGSGGGSASGGSDSSLSQTSVTATAASSASEGAGHRKVSASASAVPARRSLTGSTQGGCTFYDLEGNLYITPDTAGVDSCDACQYACLANPGRICVVVGAGLRVWGVTAWAPCTLSLAQGLSTSQGALAVGPPTAS